MESEIFSKLSPLSSKAKSGSRTGAKTSAKGETDPRAREGAVWGLVFLPTALPREALAVFLPKALGLSLNAIADEAEPVREAALRASKAYVAQFSLSDCEVVLCAFVCLSLSLSLLPSVVVTETTSRGN